MNNNKIPEHIIELLKPIIDAQKKINEIILQMIPEYYVKEIKDNSTDD